ncbi:MAG: Clp protease [Treponema sp.]|nr:MAG: Clp protease [Treponema sp.]
MIQEFSKDATMLFRIYAYNEAKNVNAKFLEPEHVLLAIIKNKYGMGYHVLEKLGVNIINLQLQLEQKLPVGNEPIQDEQPPLSRRMQTAVNVAAIESRSLRAQYIGTEHFVLAFAHENNSEFYKFLELENKHINDIRSVIAATSGKERFDFRQGEKKEKSLLDEMGVDLTEKYKMGLLDPVIGREKETNRIIQVLARRRKNNPILVGEPGVGKTSIIEGLAANIVNEDVPRVLLGKRIIVLEIGTLVAGTKYRGQFEEKIKKIVQEASRDKSVILFIDEIHTIVGSGMGQNSLDAADLLKPALARGIIQCIGATTQSEYRNNIEKDAALERRFQSIQIKEPEKEETLKILQGVKSKYEVYHNVEYSFEALEKAVELSGKYIQNKAFPDKAIDIIDEAGAMKKIEIDRRPDEFSKVEESIARLIKEKNIYVEQQDYESAAYLRDEVRKLKNELERIKIKWQNPECRPLGYVLEKDIIKTISVITGVPLEDMSQDETEKLLKMESILSSDVIGQDFAVKVLSNAIRRSRAGITAYDRPIGSFLFLGPTGVGKTLLAKKLAKFLFGKESNIIRIDMSDFMEKHNVARLTGAPPGYVGFENGGLLTEKVRKNSYSVILFDEIEKAHQDVFNLLLQILEEGELQDNLGHTVSFRNTVIIMTSNAGARSIINESRLGFNMTERGVMDYQDIKLNSESEIKELLSPEFINRIDDILVFSPLDRESIAKIFRLEFDKLKIRLDEKDITIMLSENAEDFFVENGYSPSYGARPMRRLLQTEIEDPLAQKIIAKELASTDTVQIDAKDGNILISIIKSEEGLPEKISVVNDRSRTLTK